MSPRKQLENGKTTDAVAVAPKRMVGRPRKSLITPNTTPNNRHSTSTPPVVQRSGRIKKSTKIFDPSDNIIKQRVHHVMKTSAKNAQKSQKKTSTTTSNEETRQRLLNSINAIKQQQQLLQLQTTKDKSSSVDRSMKSINKSLLVSQMPEKKKSISSNQCMRYNKCKSGPSEEYLSCKNCPNKIHGRCANVDLKLSSEPRNWSCENCSTCISCSDSLFMLAYVTCSKCFDSYHSICWKPIADNEEIKPKVWICDNCSCDYFPKKFARSSTANGKTVKQENNDTTTKRYENKRKSELINRNSSGLNDSAKRSVYDQQDSISNFMQQSVNIKTEPIEMNGNHATSIGAEEKVYKNGMKEFVSNDLPDPSGWTKYDVYEYFTNKFPSEAGIMLDQDIDGSTILLMKRSDVLRGLKIKLGPALKIYSYILKLQTHNADPRIAWK